MGKPKRYVIADTETASLRGPDEVSSGVAEVAMLEIDLNLNPLGLRTSLINPGRLMEEAASAVNGLTDDMLADKPLLHDWMAENWDDSPTVFIAHNVPFDIKFLARGIPLMCGHLCTLALARQYIPNAPNHKLATLADYFKLETGEAHRAAGDVYTTLSLLKLIVANSGFTLEKLVEMSNSPRVLTVMPFGKHKGKVFANVPKDYLEWILSCEDMPRDVAVSAQRALKGML